MLEYQQYQSPLHLISHFNNEINTLTKDKLPLLKKEILLELQLNENQVIKTKHYKYTKQEVLNEFENLLQDLDFHLYIWNQPELLDLLEAYEFGDKIEVIKNAIEKSPFREKIEPYLVFAIKGITRDCVNRNVYRDTLILAKNIVLEQNESFKNAYKPILVKITGFNEEFSNQNSPVFDAEKYDFLTHALFIRTFNCFPKEYNELRNDFASATIHFIGLYNDKHLAFCKEVNSTTLLLECDRQIQQLISSNYDYVDEKSKPQWMKNGMIILLVLSFLGKLISFFLH